MLTRPHDLIVCASGDPGSAVAARYVRHVTCVSDVLRTRILDSVDDNIEGLGGWNALSATQRQLVHSIFQPRTKNSHDSRASPMGAEEEKGGKPLGKKATKKAAKAAREATGKPDPPVNAYVLFCKQEHERQRRAVDDVAPRSGTRADVFRDLGAKWKALAPEERTAFEVRARELRNCYNLDLLVSAATGQRRGQTSMFGDEQEENRTGADADDTSLWTRQNDTPATVDAEDETGEL